MAWAVTGALVGLPAGAALRGPVFRLSVPSGEADRTACPVCSAPVRAWLPLRCAGCGRLLGPPGALELATAVVLGLLLGRFGGQAESVALGVFGVLAVALAAIDINVQRLPDRLTLPAFPGIAALLVVAAWAGDDWQAMTRALLGAAALGGGYLLLAAVAAGQMGGGDVKLAGVTGLVLGWLGWPTLLLGAALGFILAGVVSVALLAAQRITLRSAISFGPFMLGGGLIAMVIPHS